MTKSTNSFIGLDLGRSAVKAYARQDGKTFSVLFESAVAKARPVVFDSLQASAEADTVSHKNQDYWTGKTALIQAMGADPLGRNDDWILGIEHEVLIVAAIERLKAKGLNFEPGDAYITIGVPSRVFRERRDLVSGVRANTIAALTTASGAPTVIVQPQPLGVIARHTLDEDGYQQEGRDMTTDSFAVIEIGQFTADYSAVVKGLPVIEATDSVEGVELIVNHVRSQLHNEGAQLGATDVQALLASPKIKIRGQIRDLSPWINEAINQILLPKVITAAKNTFNPMLLQSVDAILIAGGGAPIVFDGIKADPAMCHAELIETPREAVADGFARLSALMHATEE